MQVLKIGRRFGSLNTYAVVVVGNKIKLAYLANDGRWSIILSAKYNPTTERHFTSQVF